VQNNKAINSVWEKADDACAILVCQTIPTLTKCWNDGVGYSSSSQKAQ